MRLTEQQINHFRTFGFIVFRQFFTPEEWKTYCHEFDLGLDALIRATSTMAGPGFRLT